MGQGGHLAGGWGWGHPGTAQGDTGWEGMGGEGQTWASFWG